MPAWDIVLDWWKTLGLTGFIIAAGGLAWRTFFTTKAQRGQDLIDRAQPDLRAEGNSGGQYVVELSFRNTGKGVARNAAVGFTGVDGVVRLKEIPVGSTVFMPALNVAASPLFTGDEETAQIEVRYEDRYGTLSTLTIPVARQRRNDGGYRMDFQRAEATTRHIKPSWWTLVKIGREN